MGISDNSRDWSNPCAICYCGHGLLLSVELKGAASMDEEEKGLYTVAEAAEAWGISTKYISGS